MKKVIAIPLIVLFLLAAYSCKQKENTKVEDEIIPQYTAEQLYNQLSVAVDKSSPDSLDLFFSQWNKSIKPNSDLYIEQNDTLKAVYSAFEAFYTPQDRPRMGLPEGDIVDNGVDANTRYFVVQNKIEYAVVFSDTVDIDEYVNVYIDEEGNKPDENVNGILDDFRPPVNIDKSKVLYLTDEYNKAVTRLLKEEYDELKNKNTFDDKIKYYKRLRSYTPVLVGHWGNYWHLSTHPEVHIIIFNNDFTRARLDYRIGYQGASTIIEKMSGEWKIIESKWTWIE